MQTNATSGRMRGLFDLTFWEYLDQNEMRLQCCCACSTYRYPPSAICPDCLEEAHDWRAVSGRGTVLSWTVFHRQYLPQYPAPYNVIAVRLDEGPVLVTNLLEEDAISTSIGKRVAIVLQKMDDGVCLPRASILKE